MLKGNLFSIDYIIPSSCITRWYLRHYIQPGVNLLNSSKIVFDSGFDSLNVHLLLDKLHEIIEKRSARNLQHAELTSNRLLISVMTHAGTVSNFEKPARAYFFLFE